MKKQLPFLCLLYLVSIVSVWAQTPPTESFVIRPSQQVRHDALMRALPTAQETKIRVMRPENEGINRENLPDNPDAPAISRYPNVPRALGQPQALGTPQTTSTSFDGATLTDTGAFPPDNMGAVGPTQYITFVNGRLRSFNKTTGVADGVLNADPDVFFSTVMTPVTSNFTSDPRIRYDRLSDKWILLIIDVPNRGRAANRCLIAYSDTGIITAGTLWTFTYFSSAADRFLDYPTLGLDANALYIGGNMFSTTAGSFTGCDGWVISRSALLSGGAVTVHYFAGLVPTRSSAGPYTPQGVDNFDPSPTEGYFVGVDNLVFSKLVVRRVSDPAGTPTISGNIDLTVPTTSSPTNMPHLSGSLLLDAIDDRLYAAVIRNGHLWTAHQIRVNASGVASTATGARNGVRWYDLTNLTGTPTLNQSGTIFDNNATLASARWYVFPSVMVSGQGHAVFSMSTAGAAYYANAAVAGRLADDALGTTQAVTFTTSSSTAYNPSFSRWGDYSYVSLDPRDDMTMWAINQYCQATNSYASRVTKILAPPPATPISCNPASVPAGSTSVNVTVTGSVVSGSGFYDPGANLPAPALPFFHIAGLVSGGVTVNSITYNSPTSVTLNLNTTNATPGNKDVTVTNPDGQSTTGNALLEVTCTYPVVSAPSVTQPTCVTPTGTIVVNATGTGTLEYSIGGNYQISNTFSGLAPNDYNISVRSQSLPGCVATYSANPVQIVAPSNTVVNPSITGGGTACRLEQGPSVSFMASGGTLPYTFSYTINGGGIRTVTTSGSNTSASVNASTATDGNFTYALLSVRDANGCQATPSGSNSVLVNVTPNPTITASNNSPVCAGVTIQFNTAGGTAWTWAGPNFSSNVQNPMIVGASSANNGVYSVTISSNGCTQVATTRVTVNQLSDPQASSSELICVGSTLRLSASGGSNYTWAGPGGYASNQQNPTRASATTAMSGTYSVRIQAGACGGQVIVLTTSVLVSRNIAPAITSIQLNGQNPNAQNTLTVCNNQAVDLTVAATNAAAYSWRGPTGAGSGFVSSTANPTTIPIGIPRQGQYTITARNGCAAFNHRVVNIQINCATRLAAIEEVEANDMELRPYPNPFSKMLNVEVRLTEAAEVDLQLYNSLGEVVGKWHLDEARTFHRANLELSQLQTGVYFVEAKTNRERAVRRVMKVEAGDPDRREKEN